MPPIDEHTPHRTLLALHQLVDRALEPLLGPMQLDWATESVVAVDRADLAALAAPGADPQAALVSIEGTELPALLIAEPALCSTLLARIWSSDRNSGTPLTQVEAAILQQFLAGAVGAWQRAWQGEGIECTPSLTMASTLSMIGDQMPEGRWYAARTVVLRDELPVGVLLFCYPGAVMTELSAARASIMWRSRVARAGGLDDIEREKLRQLVQGKLRHVHIEAPVVLRTNISLGIINVLERGDIISLDTPVGADLELQVLDRTVHGRLARSAGRLAIALTADAGTASGAHAAGTASAGQADGNDLSNHDPYGMGSEIAPAAAGDHYALQAAGEPR